jgi:uncharacterized membrane protein YccC
MNFWADVLKVVGGAVLGAVLTALYNRLKAGKAAANHCRDQLDSLCSTAELAIRCRQAGEADSMTECKALTARTDFGQYAARLYAKSTGYARIRTALETLDIVLDVIDAPAGNLLPGGKTDHAERLRQAQKEIRNGILECCKEQAWYYFLGDHQTQP